MQDSVAAIALEIRGQPAMRVGNVPLAAPPPRLKITWLCYVRDMTPNESAIVPSQLVCFGIGKRWQILLLLLFLFDTARKRQLEEQRI
jgi:hypothetical protein